MTKPVRDPRVERRDDRVAVVVRRRDDPEFTLDQARDVKITALDGVAADPPTTAVGAMVADDRRRYSGSSTR